MTPPADQIILFRPDTLDHCTKNVSRSLMMVRKLNVPPAYLLEQTGARVM